jgi:protein-disulfide isomerase
MSPDQGTNPTRKQRREQAREQRKAAEEQAASATQRKRLIQLSGALGLVVVVIVIILIATAGGGSKKTVAPTSKAANETVTAVKTLIGGIPQHGNALGNPKAPVTLQYFGDLECPICADFTTKSLPTIIPKWVRTGKLRIEYHSMSTATGNAEKEGAEPEGIFNGQQIAALAAGKQNLAWYYIETFYHEQGQEDSGYVTESYIQGLAEQIPGLNLSKWTADRSDPELTNEIATDAQAVNNEGFNGTPSFLIGRSGGAMKKLEYTNPEDPTFVNEAVEKLLKT